MLDGIQPQINELSDTLEASTEYSFICLRLSSIAEPSSGSVEESRGRNVRDGRKFAFQPYRIISLIPLTCWLACSNQVTKSHVHDAWANILLDPSNNSYI